MRYGDKNTYQNYIVMTRIALYFSRIHINFYDVVIADYILLAVGCGPFRNSPIPVASFEVIIHLVFFKHMKIEMENI